MIPELIDIGAERMVLPLGRYSCTLEEVQERYVPKDDANRNAIWEGFLKTVDLIKGAVGSLAEVWIGGSFITNKEHPHDIDVVFFFKEGDIEEASHAGSFVLNVLARKLESIKRLNEYVDGYLVVVQPTEIENKDPQGWISMRGYWDQFWSKTRFGDDDARWLYPAAGYLEVMIDGYND